MNPDRRRLVGIYLNDHLAAATVTVGRARATRDSNQDSEFFEPLAALCRDLEEDQASLEAIMAELGVGRSRIKPPAAALGEKAGRLKPNGRLRGYSPLGRVIDLEVMLLGITGTLRLWKVLAEIVDQEASADLDDLSRRAEDQRSRTEALQERAAHLL